MRGKFVDLDTCIFFLQNLKFKVNVLILINLKVDDKRFFECHEIV